MLETTTFSTTQSDFETNFETNLKTPSSSSAALKSTNHHHLPALSVSTQGCKSASAARFCGPPAPLSPHLASFCSKGSTRLLLQVFSIDAKSVPIHPSSILISTSGTIFAHRSKAKLEKMLWEDALLDAQKVIELEPSSHVGYHLKHTALRGAKRYREAVDAFQMMHAKLASAHSMQIRKLYETYISPSKAKGAIRKVINDQLDNVPLRLLGTDTGLLCDWEAQISAFKTSTEYNELLLSIMMHPDLPIKRIAEAVATYFRYVMLSHRWGDNEPLLHDIHDKTVYKLKAAGGLVKLQSFCKLVRRAGFHWATTTSSSKNHSTPLLHGIGIQRSRFVYLSDVLPSSKPGALAKSDWNTRGWTVPEFLAPKAIRFYQQDWTPYLDDHSPNHKESVEIMDELEDATGIDARALVTFQPGMRDAREKLRWASTRVTTIPEDIAYSLFGIFGIQLPILYGEIKQNALGRLLQEIVARSGDITALDWVGQPSEFNSCLPADITSYAAPPCLLPSLSEDEIKTAVSSLQQAVAADLVSNFHDQLEQLRAPRFANCRLRLPCMTFRVTEVRRRSGPPQETIFTYRIKADGLDDLLLTTEEKLIQFSRERPTRQTFLFVRPWDRRLLELPDFADDAESSGGWSEPESLLDDSDESVGDSPGEEVLGDSESHSRGLRLIVRLGQPFAAFVSAQQRGGEYKRIASDHHIIAQITLCRGDNPSCKSTLQLGSRVTHGGTKPSPGQSPNSKQRPLASTFNNVIIFYQQDRTPYLDSSPNHKKFVEIMHESEDHPTGTDTCVFQPGMKDAREKLQWASMHDATVPEDNVYSLSNIFGVYVPAIHGENKQRALGRLLQEIVAESGDITLLDWVGQSSEFNSCLPADVASYATPPRVPPSLSEDEIRTAYLSIPRFAHRRLHLPCITFRVTEVRRRRDPGQDTPFSYEVKADGLQDLLITSEQRLIQFSQTRPTPQTFLLVRSWDRRLLELPDFANDTESLEDWSEPEAPGGSPGQEMLADPEPHSQALRLIVRLGQPFSAFLLARQRGGGYKRIASDYDITAQVKDVTFVPNMMDIRTLEIL
ncbi:hypothetical protein EDB19DRAFT_1983963 [Suillus lakei]|nr:hypothetical protein EDB19DRAFT_1983963 [Suillus lakei]